MRRPRGLRFLVAALAILLVAGACRSTEGARPGAAPEGPSRLDRLRLAAGPGGYPSPIGPQRSAITQANLMFDALVWTDSTGKVIPWIATSWERSPDGTEWTYTIRDGVRWHDGNLLTAADVVFTYEYLISGAGRAAAGIFGKPFIDNFKEVVSPAPNQVVFRMHRPWATFLVLITAVVRILPAHVWRGVSDPAKFTGPQAVMGSGPYRLDSYDVATGAAAFVANESHFLGPPYVRRIEFVPVADPLLALQQGEIDMADAGTEDQLPEQALKQFDRPQFGSVTGPSDWNRALHFNLKRGFPFDDARFRQAMAYAIDRRDMVERILFGQGLPGSSGGLAPSHQWAASGLPPYDRDVAKARSLLNEIGLRDVDGDGVRELPDGSRFLPELQTSTQFSSRTAELISEYLRAVGIAVKLKSLEAVVADDSSRKGNYDMALLGYGGVGNDPDVLTRIRFSPQAITIVAKVHGYNNARIEELGLLQLHAADDGARKAAVQEIQRIVADELPMISLYFPTPRAIFAKSVFSAWYFTPGGIGGTQPGVLNKHAFVTGKKAGF